jgi:hypothetical protein
LVESVSEDVSVGDLNEDCACGCGKGLNVDGEEVIKRISVLIRAGGPEGVITLIVERSPQVSIGVALQHLWQLKIAPSVLSL